MPPALVNRGLISMKLIIMCRAASLKNVVNIQAVFSEVYSYRAR